MKNLAIARAGDQSKHVGWLIEPEKKNFDLLVAYYGDTPGKWDGQAEFYDHTKGLKYPWFEEFLRRQPWVLDYDAVWLADDDLDGDTATIADAFDIFHTYGLSLAQPSLTGGSVATYPIFRRKPGLLLRYIGFVEEQMPIFSKECLRRVRHTLGDSKSGWGLGIAWAQILGHLTNTMAVIDATPLRHARPLQTSDMYTCILPALGKDPMGEFNEIRKAYQDDIRLDVYGKVELDPSDVRTPDRRRRQRG